MRPLQTFSNVLSAVTVFLGAFLIFAVEPIAGKQLLPYFGGASSVWATSLLFFTFTLFLGYLYVYVITKFSPIMQRSVHLCLIALASFFVLVLFIFSDGLFILPNTEGEPFFSVFMVLAFSIGIPYFLLSTTAPLIQYWYGVSKGKEPYSLYALSNAASLLALLSYPFVIEPFIQLRLQRGAWVVLFLVYAASCIASVFSIASARRQKAVFRKNSKTPGFRAIVLWVLLAALPSFLLVATTTEITQRISSVPMLWIVPLAIYLLTFIIAFSARGGSLLMSLLFLVSSCVAWWFLSAGYDKIAQQILSYLALLFFCGLLCHVFLYRMRPKVSSLPLFYLFISLGGAVGVLASGIIAPLVFKDFWEFPISVAISCALAVYMLPVSFFPRILDIRNILITKLVLVFFVMSSFGILIMGNEEIPSIATRNFYGNARVVFGSNAVSLMHGTTFHGMQFADKAKAQLPTTYYTPGSGIGRALIYARDSNRGKGINVGVVGLGTGTIASYCAPGDKYVFYEIDSRIEQIARSYFSYLSNCEGSEVRIGDGRILLESERGSGMKGGYDVLAVDAFSDDTIPTHLLTVEAFEAYAGRLRSSKGLIVIHLSNRYLNLAPLVFRVAADIGFNAMFVQDGGGSGLGGTPSAWMVLSKDVAVFQSTIFANTNSSFPNPIARAWTDDYSSLMPILDISMPWD